MTNSPIKFRLHNKDSGITNIYSLSKLINTTFRKGKFEFRGRFTGLKDKNGTDIYEGDILASTERPDVWQALVYFEFGAYEIKDPRGRIGGQYNMYGTLYEIVGDEGNDYKIIGNIYENPELLHDG